MFRRFICLITAAGFVATQAAIIPHAHGSGSAEFQREHDANPHFHWGSSDHNEHHHDHTHAESGDSHSGHHHQQKTPTSPCESSTEQPVGVLSPEQHDADAIYLPAMDCSAYLLSRTHSLSKSVQVTEVPAPLVLGGEHSGMGQPIRCRPPDAVVDGSETYLILRNLRI